MNIGIVFIIIFELLYWCSEGLIQGWIWVNPQRRDNNGLIVGNKKIFEGMSTRERIKWAFKLPWDFHFVRVFEIIGIIGFGVSSKLSHMSFMKWGIIVIGTGFIGAAFYEALLNYVNTGKIYKDKGWRFKIGGTSFPWPTGYLGLALLIIIGLLILLFGILRMN